MEQRKYQMIRIKAGDYLLPSNDGKTLWRIYQYEEEGSLEQELSRGVYRKIVGVFWACEKRPMPTERESQDEDFLDTGWEFWSGMHRTRSEAISFALRAGEVAAQRER